jgi:[ribosomal protein S18]-alanine N-acetyltransferase
VTTTTPASEAVIRPLASSAEAQECARMMASSEPWVTLGRSYEASLRTLQDTAKEVYVASMDERLVGFLIVNMQGPFAGYIQTVCVHPEHRGRGLGGRLVGWAEERILRDSPNVFMCVSSFNLDARRLYERLGYTVVGELKDYIVRGHSELLLRKSTGPWATFQPSSTRPSGASIPRTEASMRSADPHYEFLLGSDEERDGIFLELVHLHDGKREVLLEAFRADDDALWFNVEGSCQVPFAVVEQFVRRARTELSAPATSND